MTADLRITSSLAIPASELVLRFTRSAGPGGQNVNKVSTRVELLFDIQASAVLSGVQKERLASALASRLDSAGVLHIASQESRSQWRNREDVLQKLAQLLRKGLAIPKRRLATRATSSSRERRLKGKQLSGAKKRLRGPIRDTHD